MNYNEIMLNEGETPVLEFNHPIWAINENADDVIELPANKEHWIPLFEIGDSIDITQDPQQMSSQFNNVYKQLSTLRSKFSHCETITSLIRTDWTFLAGYGAPKGPEVSCDTIQDMFRKAQTHRCSKRNIVSFDFPRECKLGFACSCGIYWTLSLKNLKEDPDKKILATNEERKEIGKQLNDCSYFPDLKPAITQETELETDEEGNGFEPNCIHMFTTRCLFGF